MKELLEKLATEGGMIICTSQMEDEWIEQARASERLWVDNNGIGYVWEPYLMLPTTAEEVRVFEKYYPLPVQTPPLDFEKLWQKINEPKQVRTPRTRINFHDLGDVAKKLPRGGEK